jgi:hypothetical protein
MRESNTVKLGCNGKELVTKAYLTGREDEEITLGYHDPAVEAGKPSGVLAGVAGQHKMIEVCVLSYDGSSENILDRILDDHKDVRMEVRDICTELYADKAKK